MLYQNGRLSMTQFEVKGACFDAILGTDYVTCGIVACADLWQYVGQEGRSFSNAQSFGYELRVFWADRVDYLPSSRVGAMNLCEACVTLWC